MRTADSPELFVTNFHRRFTGVSATADAVVSRQRRTFDMRVVGSPLPHAPTPVSYAAAVRLSLHNPTARPFAIWHVRRNLEMSAAIFARDVLRLPIRVVFTSAAQRRHSPLPRALIARMDAVIATTEKAAQLVPHVAGVVPHGVDVDRFTPSIDRDAEWRQSGFPGRYGIGIVGRVRSEKGTDLFVESLCRALHSRPDFTGLVIGRAKPSEHQFEQMLRERIAAAGLVERIRFLGEIPATEMPGLMRKLSLLVAPARYEGYGMTPLEAMASGVAVLASDTGAYSTMIDPRENGRIVPIDDLQSLTEALLELTADPVALQASGMRGRHRAVERFSLECEAAGLSKIYEQVWNGKTF